MISKFFVFLKIFTIFCLISKSSGNVFIATTVESYNFSTTTVHYFDEVSGAFMDVQFFLNETEILFGPDLSESQDVTDKVIIVPFQRGIDNIALFWQEKGAKAMIMGNEIGSMIGKSQYQMHNPRRQINIPTLEISEHDYEEVLRISTNETILYITLQSTPESQNVFYEVYTTTGTVMEIFGYVLFAPLLIIIVVLSVFEFMSDRRLKLNIRRCILIMIFIANILRFIGLTLDPNGKRKLLGWYFNNFIVILNFNLTVICELMVSIFWCEVLNRTGMKKDNILIYTRVPFTIVIIILLAIFVITSVISIIIPEAVSDIITFLGYIFLLFLFLLSIFHFVMFINFYVKLINVLKIRNKKKKNARIFLIKMLVLTLVDFLLLAVLVFIALGEFQNFPWVGALTPLMFFGLTGIHSIVIVTMFTWQTPGSDSSGGGGTTTRKTRKTETKTDT